PTSLALDTPASHNRQNARNSDNPQRNPPPPCRFRLSGPKCRFIIKFVVPAALEGHRSGPLADSGTVKTVVLLMKLTAVALFVLGLLVGGGGVFYWQRQWPTPAPSPSVSTSATPIREVSALGRIQPYGGVIAIGVTLPDQLAKLAVKGGKLIE